MAPAPVGKPHTLESMFKLIAPGLVFDADSGERVSEVDVFVQGVSPPLTSPVAWLCENCAHPDDFLYIAAVKRRSLS